MQSEWYTVKGLFRWFLKASNDTANYEERLILVNASSFDNALDQTELEAKGYCDDDPEATFGIESLSKYRAYLIVEGKLAPMLKIYSQRFYAQMDKQVFLEKCLPGDINNGGQEIAICRKSDAIQDTILVRPAWA